MSDRLVHTSIILVGLVVVIGLLFYFQTFLRPFAMAVLLMFLLLPITRWSRSKRYLVIGSTVLLVVALSVVFVVIGSIVFNEISMAEQALPEGEQVVEQNVEQTLDLTKISFGGSEFDVTQYVQPEKISGFVTQIVSRVTQSIFTIFSEVFLVILFLLFLLPSYTSFTKRIAKDLGSSSGKKFFQTLTDIESSIRAYLVTKTLVSLGTAVVSFVIMLLFGVDFPLLFAVLIFFLNYIPNIGSFVAVGVVLLTALFTQGFGIAFIALGVLLILVQILFGNIIEPKFAGQQLELSPVIILLSLFFWAAIWGVGGMLLAVPMTSILKIILLNISSTKKVAAFMN